MFKEEGKYMKRYPIHSVQRKNDLGLYDLTAPTIKMDPYGHGKEYEILESDPGWKGRGSYVVIQTSSFENGTPHYTAYTNDPDVEAMLTKRMAQTYEDMTRGAVAYDMLKYQKQENQPPTLQDMLAIRHAENKNKDMSYRAMLFDDSSDFRKLMIRDAGPIYEQCSREDIKAGDQIMIFGHTHDIEHGHDEFGWRGIQVSEADCIDGACLIEGFEFEHTANGSIQFLGTCSCTNIDYSHELQTIKEIGLEVAVSTVQSGSSITQPQSHQTQCEFLQEFER